MRRNPRGLAIAAVLAPAMFGQAPAPPMQDRLLHLIHITTVQEFQEIANVVRVITETRDMSADNSEMSLTVHGTAEQVGLAEWLVQQLDQPAGAPPPATSPEYKGLSDSEEPGRPGEQRRPITNGVARIFYLPRAATVQEFQQTANAIRTVTEIRRVNAYNLARALVVRGTPGQIAMAEWLVAQLDRPDGKPAGSTDSFSAGDDDVMRVFFLANASSVSDLQEMANTVRSVAEIRRMFSVNDQRVVLVRGTTNEMAMAEWLLAALDKPAGPRTNQASGDFRVPGKADDVIRVFYLPDTKSAQEVQAIANGVRSAAQIRRLFTYGAQRAVAVRGTVEQLALAETLIRDLTK